MLQFVAFTKTLIIKAKSLNHRLPDTAY